MYVPGNLLDGYAKLGNDGLNGIKPIGDDFLKTATIVSIEDYLNLIDTWKSWNLAPIAEGQKIIINKVIEQLNDRLIELKTPSANDEKNNFFNDVFPCSIYPIPFKSGCICIENVDFNSMGGSYKYFSSPEAAHKYLNVSIKRDYGDV